jgi:sugar phosphate permease
VGDNGMKESGLSAVARKLYRQRWRIWIVASLAHTISLFHRAAMAPIADRVMADFDITAVAFGSLGAVYFYIYAAMQLPSGTLADTLGPRKTIAAGLFVSAVGSTLMGLAPSFSMVYVGRLVVSFGVSVAWLSLIKIVMEWFHARERGTMVGLSGALANTGQLAATTPLALLVMWIGWRMSLVTIGQISLVLAVANWFIVRDSPAKIGLSSSDMLDMQGGIKNTMPVVPVQMSLAQRLRAVFGNKYIWPLFLFAFGAYGAFSTFTQNWAVVYVMQVYGVERDSAATFVLFTAIGHVISFALAGFVSDRMRRRRMPVVMFTGIFLAAILTLTLWNGGRPPIQALYPLCFFIGFGIGAVPLVFAIVGDLVQPAIRGLAGGLVNSGLFIGAAMAQPVFGYILDLGWRGDMIAGARVYPLAAFQQGFYLCCAMAAMGFIGALLVKETHCQAIYAG